MIKILGGDFGEDKHAIMRTGYFTGKMKVLIIPKWFLFSDTIRRRDIQSVEQVTDDNKVNVLGAIGGGAVGALIAGPIGALAGSLLGGRGKAVVCVVTLCDNRRFLCSASIREFEQLLAAAMATR